MLRIALDGPAASGKSSVAKAVSKKIGIPYLDTGAMYRCIALLFYDNDIDINNDASVEDALKSAVIDFHDGSVFMNGSDVGDAIRKPEISEFVPRVAMLSQVRKYLGLSQIEAGRKSDIVMDGRDIGSVIMPDAEYKFFLTATPEERARRRQRDLAAKGFDVDIDVLTDEIELRDKLDREREHAPLIPAKDAIIIDTTSMSFDDVVDAIICKIKDRDD